MKVTASYARQNFAALLERAVAGEEILIERHGRQVARLLPAAAAGRAALPANEARVAEVRGVDPRSALSRVLRERALKRLALAYPRAQSCVAKLSKRGAKVRIVGSMARGAFRQSSDVDILVEDPGPLQEEEIERIARREMRDFPFDLIYAHKLPPGLKRHFAQ
jgi:prevent-host-death family protein